MDVYPDIGGSRMNLLHITDLEKGNIQVSWQRGNAIARSYPRPIQFTDPLSINDRSELRWYLEDYLTFPYGAERWRAEQVENKMSCWFRHNFRNGCRNQQKNG